MTIEIDVCWKLLIDLSAEEANGLPRLFNSSSSKSFIKTLGGRAKSHFYPASLSPNATFYNYLNPRLPSSISCPSKFPFTLIEAFTGNKTTVHIQFRLYGGRVLALTIKRSPLTVSDDSEVDFLAFQDLRTNSEIYNLVCLVTGLVKRPKVDFKASTEPPKVFSCLRIQNNTDQPIPQQRLIEALTRHRSVSDNVVEALVKKNSQLKIDASDIFVDRQGVVSSVPSSLKHEARVENRFVGACNMLELMACVERMLEQHYLQLLPVEQWSDLRFMFTLPDKRFLHSTSSGNMWQVLAKDFGLNNLDWNKLAGNFENLKQGPKILLVTAFDKEAAPLQEKLLDVSLTEIDSYYVTKGYYSTDKRRAEIYIFVAGVGNTPAAVSTTRLIGSLKPELTIFCGIAGGRKEAAIGDVVVANLVYNYESGKEHTGGFLNWFSRFSPRPRTVELSRKANSLMNAYLSRHPEQEGYKAYFKPIACGEKLLANSKGRPGKSITLTYSDALAVEMEGFGFLSAMVGEESPGVLIRGISDRVDKKTEQENHSLATKNAADFTFRFLNFFTDQCSE
jgi:nucleoside phosphorylase